MEYIKVSSSLRATEEIWRDIKGYEGFYQVSNRGRVRSVDRVVENRGFPRNQRGKTIKLRSTPFGYLDVGLHKEGKYKRCRVHRLVAEAFIDNPENKPEVNHDDGDKTNNHVRNLYWATRKENMDHAVATGLLNVKGENNYINKLTQEEVKNIISTLQNTNQSIISIAKDYNINRQSIYNINTGISWSWLLPETQRPIRPIQYKKRNSNAVMYHRIL